MVTIGAVIVGGFWTYNVFVKERHEYAYPDFEVVKISHVSLGQENLLNVRLEITNGGNSRLEVNQLIVRLQQILPLPPCPNVGPCAVNEVEAALKNTERQSDRFDWPLIAERHEQFQSLELAPGEKSRFDLEFAAPSEITAVRVYAYIQQDVNRGFAASSYYDFHQTAAATK